MVRDRGNYSTYAEREEFSSLYDKSGGAGDMHSASLCFMFRKCRNDCECIV